MDPENRRAAPTDGLSIEDLDGEQIDALPARQAMTTINVGLDFPVDNFAMPVNDATAMNIASPDSMAIADADQIVVLDQFDVDGVDEQ